MGYNATEILNLFNYYGKSIVDRHPLYMFSSMKANKGFEIDGMRSGENIEIIIHEAAKYKGIRYLKDLQIPIVIPTVDMNDGAQYIFTNSSQVDGTRYIKDFEISKAVRASSTFPVYFAPFEHGKHRFIDGGTIDNVPVKEVRNIGAEKILTVDFFVKFSKPKNNIISITLRTLDIMTNEISKKNLSESDYLLTVDAGETKILQMSKVKECYTVGYNTAMEHMDAIKESLLS